MSETQKEREVRALDALIVSALRRDERGEDEIDVKRLPRLTDEERAAMEALGADFVERLLAGAHVTEEEDFKPGPRHGQARSLNELAFAGADEGNGLNRADEFDEETIEERDRQKREIIERKKREREEGGRDGG